jgi:ATP-dependent helicase/nuclease subunit A
MRFVLYALAGAKKKNGALRQANLRLLHEYAAEFEKSSRKGLFHFLRFLEERQAQRADLEGAKILAENSDVVRLMTIHKSKGLEFPVCFVSGLCDRFNQKDLMPDLVFHEKYGVGSKIRDLARGIKYPTITDKSIKAVMKREMLAEEINIFYVALTRAKEKLILTGAMASPKEKAESLLPFLNGRPGPLAPLLLEKCANYFQYLFACLLRNETLCF